MMAYIGEFDSGCEQGWGVWIFRDGVRMEKQFEASHLTGRQVLTFSEGFTITGEVQGQVQHKVLRDRIRSCSGEWRGGDFVRVGSSSQTSVRV